MNEPQQRTVRVRRSPRIVVFLALGAALGAVAALVLIAVSPVDPVVPTPQALGFLVLLLAPVGALLGGAVAIALEAVGERRARTVEAEHTVAAPPAALEEGAQDAGADGSEAAADPEAPADSVRESTGPVRDAGQQDQSGAMSGQDVAPDPAGTSRDLADPAPGGSRPAAPPASPLDRER